MANVINATSTGNGGLVSTGDDSGILNIQTNETTAITVDASQQVGIGVTPKTYSNGKALQINTSSLNDDAGGSFHISQNGYYNNAWKYVQNGTAERITYGSGVISFFRAASNSSGADAALTWSESMRINSSGNLLVGGTTDQTTRILAYATGGTDFFAGFNGATKNFAVASSGQIYSQFTSITSLSDRRTKTQISAISYGLNEVNELNPVTFFFNGDTSNKLYGFIAQDVQSILPELVSESSNKAEDGTSYLTLKMGDMLPVLVKAIQELKAINDTQAETINALTARVTALEGN